MWWCYADSLMGESAKHSVNTTHSKRFHTLGRSEKSARSLVHTTVYSWQLSNRRKLCARGRLKKKIYICVRTMHSATSYFFFYSLSSSLEKISCRHPRGRLIGKQCAKGKKGDRNNRPSRLLPWKRVEKKKKTKWDNIFRWQVNNSKLHTVGWRNDVFIDAKCDRFQFFFVPYPKIPISWCRTCCRRWMLISFKGLRFG